jgi:hypothetical protein
MGKFGFVFSFGNEKEKTSRYNFSLDEAGKRGMM